MLVRPQHISMIEVVDDPTKSSLLAEQVWGSPILIGRNALGSSPCRVTIVHQPRVVAIWIEMPNPAVGHSDRDGRVAEISLAFKESDRSTIIGQMRLVESRHRSCAAD